MTSLFAFVTGMRAMIPLAAVISLAPLTDTLAFDATSIQRIKKSKECQYCDLSWADLSEQVPLSGGLQARFTPKGAGRRTWWHYLA